MCIRDSHPAFVLVHQGQGLPGVVQQLVDDGVLEDQVRLKQQEMCIRDRYYIFNDHNEEDLAVGVREGVEEDTNKRNRNDFVLWFAKSKFEDQALKRCV